MTHFISCYDQESLQLLPVETPHSVYVYVKQLEHCIKHPETSKLKDTYPFRFGKEIEDAEE